ncbi:hypothetical protein FisN_29Hh105 [Fistulifera solaris]|uniref:AB hydrolase-1 domain-containing protein n=1 Tax=Fistulifera solaris TaxID=1519565 RepID=A0A1Z5K629_FISSO|nr:hypothetical protein FisN_29Hh105 [Fistulifera solaris]|eukprot:GAX21666.1 hypothetical protein FisN_29Hh105 [Fistulifera solaris]
MSANMRTHLEFLLAVFFGLLCYSQSFLFPVTRKKLVVQQRTSAQKSTIEKEVALRTYSYKDYNVTYRYKPPAPGHERDAPLLLIHPVGIGLSSWFWENFMDAWEYGGPVYAPDLWGCGTVSDNDLGQMPSSSFPDRWVEACESMLSLAVDSGAPKKSLFPFVGKSWSSPSTTSRWVVVAQGGLAPIGVRVAHRNPSQISHLILTSPPTWSDMTTAIPLNELQRNDQFLRSPVWGSLAFGLLETRWAVSFFSNLFLFASNHVNDTTKWLDCVQAGVGPAQRYAVMSFNAGFCQQVSNEKELTELPQPTLILQGDEDKSRNRHEYVQKMKDCRIQTILGKNVLPWESPDHVCRAIQDFLDT